MKNVYKLLLVLFLFQSCASWHGQLVAVGNDKDIIINFIYDFINTSPLSRKDSVFSVYAIKNNDKNFTYVNIQGSINKVLVSTNDGVNFSYNGVPNSYILLNNKLFYWYDSTKENNNELIKILYKYNQIDTMIADVYIPERFIDDRNKSENYYFCNNNFLNYKKFESNSATDYRKPPILNCK